MKSIQKSSLLYPNKELIDRDFKYTYQVFFERVCRLANILDQLGVRKGDRVATIAGNTYQHLELYFAVPCVGAVLHAVNIRLYSDQVAYIMNHAKDKIVFIDKDFFPLIEDIKDKLETVETYVIMTKAEDTPPKTLPSLLNYDDLLNNALSEYKFPDLSENEYATTCYTTGTTGVPKGVLFTQRQIYLHTLAIASPTTFKVSERDTILHCVPMYHVHSWGLPYLATWLGMKQVFPGVFDPKLVCELIEREKVSITAMVPTMLVFIKEFSDIDDYNLSSLRYIYSGGSATPKSLIETFSKRLGITVVTGYGLTETCPVLTKAHLKSHMETWPEERKFEVYAKTGLPITGVELKVINEAGDEVQPNNKEIGEIVVKTPWMATEYYNDPVRSAETWKNGWFHTGDVAVVDEEGYITIVDRLKDIILSGGEIIPTVPLENLICKHPAVLEAGVIALPHQKWGERPYAYVVLKAEYYEKITEQDIISFLEGKVVKWWIPDEVIFREVLPKTSVGKIDKKSLRKQAD